VDTRNGKAKLIWRKVSATEHPVAPGDEPFRKGSARLHVHRHANAVRASSYAALRPNATDADERNASISMLVGLGTVLTSEEATQTTAALDALESCWCAAGFVSR
jgi:hypothetical protein